MASASETALVLFAHGSLVCGAGRVLAEHARRLREGPGAAWCSVGVGYLNYDAPTFAQAVASAVNEAGARRVVVAPFFLVSGRFVTRDLRDAVTEVRARWPQIEFFVAQPLGHSPLLARAVLQMAQQALPLAEALAGFQRWRPRPDFCEAKPRCPLRKEGVCTAPLGGRAAVDATSTPPGIADRTVPSAPRPATLAAASPQPGPRALLLMAHGSRMEEANRAVERVADDVRRRGEYDFLQTGFLDCAAPDIASAADACVSAGAQRVVAVPFFLHPGRHATLDVPALLAEAGRRHAAVHWWLAPWVGEAPELATLLAERAMEALRRSIGTPVRNDQG